MARSEKAYYEPRAARGYSERVFLDPSSRRRARIRLSALTFIFAVVCWLVFFSFALVSNQGLDAALPDEINMIKRGFAQTGVLEADGLAPSSDTKPPAIETYHLQQAAKYHCQAGDDTARRRNDRVFAVVPTAFPWAPMSLDDSCGGVDVLLPTWFDVQLDGGDVAFSVVSAATRQPVIDYARRATPASVQIMPTITLGPGISRSIEDAQGRNDFVKAFDRFLVDAKPVQNLLGYCLDGSKLAPIGTGAFADIVRPLSRSLHGKGMDSCIRLPSVVPDSVLVLADRYFDHVIVKGYNEPWVGSTPQPIATDHWFAAHVASAQEHVSEDKLVIELGTFSVDWVSRQPRPNRVPFSAAMAAMADAQTRPEFVAATGNSRARYVDAQGLQHQLWMLDAASAQNQLVTLRRLNVRAVGLGALGYEDPGIWALLDQRRHARHLSAETLESVVFSYAVEHLGTGPFVAPVSMPEVGQRRVEIDPDTNMITDVIYEELPRPAKTRLYGQGGQNKVVLTFDDGPHPEFTPETLDILRETNTPGSFFVLGSAVLNAPDLVRRILDEGHELGSHTYWHPVMSDISAARATAEVNSVQMLVNGITGKSMRLYREPYMRSGGPVTSKEVASLLPLEEAGYIIAGMDVVPRDWEEQTADELANEIIAQVERNAGGVVLLHDGGGDQAHMVGALPKVIGTLRARGYIFTSIADYLNTTPELLLPDSDRFTSTLNNFSFLAVSSSWSVLEIIFWTVFAIGLFRGIVMLLLMAARKRHVPEAVESAESAPSVTVVIPAYNEAHVIGKCISRVLATRYSNFDVVVVNDGSTDDTFDEAMMFADHPLVTVISQPNGGKASALNAALHEADSEILVVIDADSQISPTAVGQMAAHFSNPKIGAVAGRVIVGNRHNVLTRMQALEYITAQSVERRAKETLNAITVVPGAIGAWRTTALLEAGIFSSETLTEDADMTMAVIRSNYRIVYEDRAFATTETPATVGGLLTQRLRWSLGMMQAAWKHSGAIFEGRYLGLVALPDLAVFGYLMPLIAPLADLFLLILAYNFVAGYGTTSGDFQSLLTNPLVLAYLALPLLELLTVLIAFRLDPKESRRLILLMPLQRVFYRQILYISVIRAVWRAMTGTLARWGRATRTGYHYDQTHLTQ